MSGTPYRGDGAKVYGLEYDGNSISASMARIEYNRMAAIKDGAITRVRKHWIDGPVLFSVSNGNDKAPNDYQLNSLMEVEDWTKLTQSAERRMRIYSAARRAFLSWLSMDRVHKPAILAGLEHLRSTQSHCRGAQMIVTLSCQGQAQSLHDWLQHRYGVKTALAISDYGHSLGEIDSFRRGGSEVLFTVGMAYEGLDAPRVTHLVHLGNYRQPSWLTQFLARAWRWGPREWPSSGRCAHLFAPCDPQMRTAIEQIERNQHADIAAAPPEESAGGGKESTGSGQFTAILDGGIF